MKLAVMQPYFFPYIGYFQLIAAVDQFVFYDDVNFIKGGWIQRNRILSTNSEFDLFGVQLSGASSNKQIKDVGLNTKTVGKLLKKLAQIYSKAPYFKVVFSLLEEVLNKEYSNIASLSIATVSAIVGYLGIGTELLISSEKFPHTKGLDRSTRLIQMCKESSANTYINPIGGDFLYDKKIFADEGILLNYLEPNIVSYPQFNNSFVSGLSIIDVVMFNAPEKVKKMCFQYDLK